MSTKSSLKQCFLEYWIFSKRDHFANREYIFRSANKQAKSAFIFNETTESAINEYLDAIESELDAAAKSLTEEPWEY